MHHLEKAREKDRFFVERYYHTTVESLFDKLLVNLLYLLVRIKKELEQHMRWVLVFFFGREYFHHLSWGLIGHLRGVSHRQGEIDGFGGRCR
jgi:hypothetical protein